MADLPADAGPHLIALARAAIGHRLGVGPPPRSGAAGDWLAGPGASFVTLTIGGALRGCIGSLEAWRPLDDDVIANAQAAAFRDPRFAPVSPGEWPDVKVEVSVLSAPEPMAFTSASDALGQLRPGIDGVIVEAGGRRATFLPQVWEDLPDPHDFLAHLLAKAGIRRPLGNDMSLARYTVSAFSENV
jgi:AmmeMemoRadiSam system protein A